MANKKHKKHKNNNDKKETNVEINNTEDCVNNTDAKNKNSYIKKIKPKIKNIIQKTLKNKNINKEKALGISVGIISFVTMFILLIFPIARYNKGIKELKENKFDEAYKTFSKINYKDSNELLAISEEKMISKIANYILDKNLEMKGESLILKSIDNSNIIQDKRLQKINYDATYENKQYQLKGSYYVERSLNTNKEWIVTNYNILSNTIVPFNEPELSVVESYIEEKFIKCEYKETKRINPTNINYVYTYKSEEEPYVIYTYDVIASYEYDKSNGKWIEKDIYNQFINKEAAKLEEKTYIVF